MASLVARTLELSLFRILQLLSTRVAVIDEPHCVTDSKRLIIWDINCFMFCIFLCAALARQQAHSVRTVHQRDGGRPEDLQRQSQPQDRQTVRGHQHHQHHRQVILRLHRGLYSFFYQMTN